MIDLQYLTTNSQTLIPDPTALHHPNHVTGVDYFYKSQHWYRFGKIAT
jgi:hypothetical protein